jgi:hypothetical protein
MTYPSIIIFAKEPSHIPLLEILIFLLTLGGFFRLFIIDQRIGLVLSQSILYHIEAVIENIFGTLRLHLTLTYTLANRIVSHRIILIAIYLIKIDVKFRFLLIVRFTLHPIILFNIRLYLGVLYLANRVRRVEVAQRRPVLAIVFKVSWDVNYFAVKFLCCVLDRWRREK